jgi:membrane protein YqaA with SNARE-associated domain
MVGIAVALWRGVIPIQWLASLGYKGIFFLSFINGVAPVAGPSQIVTFFAGRTLNPLGVGLAAGIGGAIGELATYVFGYSVRESQIKEMEHKIQRLAKLRVLKVSREHSFFPLFVLASFPNPFFKPACVVAGSLEIGISRYFIPVLLAKTLRHVIIAYAGLYTLSFSIGSSLSNLPWHALLSSFLFVAVVFGIAVIVWGLRSVFESEPDPFLLNLTFFAFAGQAILTSELVREGKQGVALPTLLVPAIILLLLQIWIIRMQVDRTLDHYVKVLDDKKVAECSEDEIERWANLMVRITGVDFYPEFYLDKIKVGSPREKRRKQAVSILPKTKFDRGEEGITPAKLVLKPHDRRRLWRGYVAACVVSWLVFIGCILIATGVV